MIVAENLLLLRGLYKLIKELKSKMHIYIHFFTSWHAESIFSLKSKLKFIHFGTPALLGISYQIGNWGNFMNQAYFRLKLLVFITENKQGFLFNHWGQMKVLVSHLCPTLHDLWTAAHQALLSMGFPWQEYWSGLPFPSPRDLPHSEIKHRSSALQADSLPTESPGESNN